MNIVLGLDPTVSLIEDVQLFLLIFLLVLYSMGVSKKIIEILLALMAILHLVFIALYANAYNLAVKIYPFLDILLQASPPRASAVIDIAQVVIVILSIDYILSRLRGKESQVTNITPTSTQEHYQ